MDTDPMVGLSVFVVDVNAGAGVPAAWFATNLLCSTAEAPSFAMPENARITTEPDVLDPVATVTVVLVVFGKSDVRTNTDVISAEPLLSAVPINAYEPPLLSEHVGAAFVLVAT